MQMVEELRADIVRSKRYDMGDLQKLKKQCVHYHKQRGNNVDGRQGAATLGDWQHLKEDLSHLNVIYASMLYVIDDEMWDIWAATLEGRQARSINGMIGLELERIMDIAITYRITSEELNRSAQQDERWWMICPRMGEEGNCHGRGEQCRHLHGVRRD